jgi:hypothetical protein
VAQSLLEFELSLAEERDVRLQGDDRSAIRQLDSLPLMVREAFPVSYGVLDTLESQLPPYFLHIFLFPHGVLLLDRSPCRRPMSNCGTAFVNIGNNEGLLRQTPPIGIGGRVTSPPYADLRENASNSVLFFHHDIESCHLCSTTHNGVR